MLTFKKKFYDGTEIKNPIVTASCGIAIADSKFPIYFLLDAARDMESKAKKLFRKSTSTTEFNIIQLPKGAIALTSISSAMPSNEYSSFVITDDPQDLGNVNLAQLSSLLNYSLHGDRSLVSDIINSDTSVREKLNLIKFMYSSIARKSRDIGIDDCEWMADVLLNEALLKASKMVIPHVWHTAEEEHA